MKLKLFALMTAALLFAASPAFAQHGHGAGAGGGMAMSHGMGSDHGNMGNAASSHGNGHSTELNAKSPTDLLSQNKKLASKLQSLLPKGTNVQTAAQGFKNLGQFVAAVHVAHNLGIPFAQLKAKMIGPPAESLGTAIHQLRPASNAKAESRKATKQADDDIKQS